MDVLAAFLETTAGEDRYSSALTKPLRPSHAEHRLKQL